jgi:pyruvate,orthophosphate dikinase
VFDSEAAVRLADAGTPVILVRRETNPDDLHGMVAAAGILTSRGGKTSHAAVVARGMGRTCVCGAETLDVDTKDPAVHHPRRHRRARGRHDLHRRLHRRGLRR